MRLFTALLVATPFLGVCIGQPAGILEHPQTQYTLAGNTTTFHCKTFGQDAFWLINNMAITEAALATKQGYYESLGFSFTDSNHGLLGYHNLTMNVSASENLNSTMIECIVVDRNFHQIESNVAYLYVFTDLRPYTPELAALTVRCQGVTPPVLHGSIRVQPRWTGYDITEIRINITYSDNGVVLQRETTIPYNDQKECHYFNETLSGCVDSLSNFSVLVSAITISSTYGESVPSPPVEARIDKDLGNISEQAINHTVYFYPNGTPFLFMEIKPPSTICSCQKVSYMIEIEDINTGQFEAQGPFHHTGHKLVTQNLISAILQRDHNYTVTVAVESSGDISTLKSYLFNTTLNLLPKPCSSNARDDTFLFQLGISMSLFIAVVITVILVILMLSYRKREQIFIALAARRAQNSHPVQYDGPVYESIHPESKNTHSTDTQQPRVTCSTSGHAQHSHPDKTEVNSTSVFNENTIFQPPNASNLTTNNMR